MLNTIIMKEVTLTWPDEISVEILLYLKLSLMGLTDVLLPPSGSSGQIIPLAP